MPGNTSIYKYANHYSLTTKRVIMPNKTATIAFGFFVTRLHPFPVSWKFNTSSLCRKLYNRQQIPFMR